MELLDKLLISKFVQQAKDGLAAEAAENKYILLASGQAGAWVWPYITKPDNMDWAEFGTYSDAVGDELVTQSILKVDRRKKRGLPGHNPLRLRLSKKWYNENRKGEGK